MGWTAPAPRHRCATTWSSVNATTARSRPPCKLLQSVLRLCPSNGPEQGNVQRFIPACLAPDSSACRRRYHHARSESNPSGLYGHALPRARQRFAKVDEALHIIMVGQSQIDMAMRSNIGSTATITGNPQNIMIGSFSQIPYVRFAAALAPVAAVGLALTVALIVVAHRSEFAPGVKLAETTSAPIGSWHSAPSWRRACSSPYSSPVSRRPRWRSSSAGCCC
jgi:hypothetical protein